MLTHKYDINKQKQLNIESKKRDSQNCSMETTVIPRWLHTGSGCDFWEVTAELAHIGGKISVK